MSTNGIWTSHGPDKFEQGDVEEHMADRTNTQYLLYYISQQMIPKLLIECTLSIYPIALYSQTRHCPSPLFVYKQQSTNMQGRPSPSRIVSLGSKQKQVHNVMYITVSATMHCNKPASLLYFENALWVKNTVAVAVYMVLSNGVIWTSNPLNFLCVRVACWLSCACVCIVEPRGIQYVPHTYTSMRHMMQLSSGVERQFSAQWAVYVSDRWWFQADQACMGIRSIII